MRRWAAIWTVIFLLSGNIGWGKAAYAGTMGGQGPMGGVDVSEARGAKITLEQAIAVAKQFVRVPEEFKNFQPGYSEGEGQGVFWNLQWSGEPDSGSISARVNAETGELWGMDQWRPVPPGTIRHGLPGLSRAQAQEKALEFLQAALPNYVNNLKVNPDDAADIPYYNLRERTTPVYYFNFVRVVNGVPFLENSASVGVNGDTGEIQSFNFNWDSKAKFPESQGLITIEQATALWRKNAGVRLIYYRTGLNEKDAQIRLVYEPKTRNMMIDAGTGEILKSEDDADYYWYERVGSGGAEKMAMLESVPLTPAEQAAMAEMEKLISKDKALAIARGEIEIPAGYKLESANLQQEYISGQKVWNFFWRSKDDEGSLNVRVEARGGHITGFNLYGPSSEQTGEPRLTEAHAREMAAGFLGKVAGGYLKDLEDLQTFPRFPYPVKPVASGKEKPKPIAYSFVATRLVNGIPFQGNGVRIDVDAVHGRITGYELRWWDGKFPVARGVIAREQAENAFLADGALGLSYRREFSRYGSEPTADRPVRLVYTLDMGKSPSFIDAFTGAGLDPEFQPKPGKNQPVFTDISGNVAVDLLAKARIIPVFEPAFHPDAKLTQRDFLIWLVRASSWQPPVTGTPDQEFERAYRQAVMLGILRPGEEYRPQDEITKLTVARLTVRALGWGEPAALTGIWALPPDVAKLVPASDQGCVALAAGLGIFDLTGKKFDPGEKLSRADGALALCRLLK